MIKYLYVLFFSFFYLKVEAQFYEIKRNDSIEVIISKNNLIQSKIKIFNRQDFSVIDEYEMRMSLNPKIDLDEKLLNRVKNVIEDYEKGFSKEQLLHKYKDLFNNNNILDVSNSLKLIESKQNSLIHLIKLDINFNDLLLRDLDIYCIDFLDVHKCTNQIISKKTIKFYNLIK